MINREEWSIVNESPKKNNQPFNKDEWTLSKEPQSTDSNGSYIKDALIGLTHAGRNLHNMPHDLVEALENGTKGLKDTFNILPGSQFLVWLLIWRILSSTVLLICCQP